MTAGNQTDLRALNGRKFDDVLAEDVTGYELGAISGYKVLVQDSASTLKRMSLKLLVDIITA